MKITGNAVAAAMHSAGGGTEAIPMPALQLQKKDETFPIHIYPPAIQKSFLELSEQYSIPLNYLGVTGLFVIGALAGNMYRGIMLEEIKPIIYACIVGPSGVGKSPAYKHLCDYIIAPLRAQTFANYQVQRDAYNERLAASKNEKNGPPFTEKPPIKKLRTITDATLEAITMHAMTSPAGFGVVYDEGERFFSGANAYKKDTSSVGFWNEMWNGRGYDVIRVDSERDRHIDSSAISVVIGLQKERLLKFFNEDTIASGLLNRFLICESDYIQLNEEADPFGHGAQVANEWAFLVTRLYHKGIQFVPGNEQRIPFTAEAQVRMKDVMRGLTKQSNQAIRELKEGDGSKLMVAYASKLHAYVPRLAVTLAIMANPEIPIITELEVNNALRLHQYFKLTAQKVLTDIAGVTESGLSDMHMKFLNALPLEFTNADAAMVAKELNYDASWFAVQFNRKKFNGWIVKTARGKYEKT